MVDVLVPKTTLIIIGVGLILTIITVAVISVTTVATDDCIIDIQKAVNGVYPLVLQSDSLDFFLPNNGSKIVLPTGSFVRLACTGQDNHFKLDKSSLLKAKCVGNTTFLVNYTSYHTFDEFGCANYSDATVQITQNKCVGNHTENNIGFSTTEGFVNLITTCFDVNKKDAIYSFHNLTSKINTAQKTDRPGFVQDTFYDNLDLDKLYTYTSEQDVFKKILGISVTSFITKKKYFNRGHLVPNADFIYTNQKRATFNYINVAPQWNLFNAGNWNNLEMSCRTFVSSKNINLLIYTGIYDTAKGNNKDLFLHYDQPKNIKLITVPKIYWKVLFEPQSKSGVVFVTQNNPLEKESLNNFCSSVCNKINRWLNWDPKNASIGLSICCEYKDAKKKITTLPELQIDTLLT